MAKRGLDPYILDRLESLLADRDELENVKSEKRFLHYGNNDAAGKLGRAVICFLSL